VKRGLKVFKNTALQECLGPKEAELQKNEKMAKFGVVICLPYQAKLG
jgi:hypothetical protein